MRGLTILGCAIATLSLYGCHISWNERESSGDAGQGDYCELDFDCEEELACNDNVCADDDDPDDGGGGAGATGGCSAGGSAVATGGCNAGGGAGAGDGGASAGSCNVHADCPQGSYCHEQGGCVESSTCSCDVACGDGFTCDEDLGTCVPAEAPPPTCDEIQTEDECVARIDCEPIYAGVDCSCGAGCECMGGEPGCVCHSFEFHACEPAP